MAKPTEPTRVKTLPTLAKELGLDRSTMVRLEQRGVISKAPMVGAPVQGRVYDEKLEAKVRGEVERYLARQAIKHEGRPPAPKNIVVV